MIEQEPKWYLSAKIENLTLIKQTVEIINIVPLGKQFYY